VYELTDATYLHITLSGEGIREGNHFRRPEYNFWTKVVPVISITGDASDKDCDYDVSAGLTNVSSSVMLTFVVVALYSVFE